MMFFRTTLFAGILLWTGCGSGPPPSPALGEAFAGPSSLDLRKEIVFTSPTVATVKHGDRLEIVQVRRRFLKVRTSAGAEGWTHETSLLSREEVEALTRLKESAASMPTQGLAIISQKTNVHTEPTRVSPSFTQLAENEKTDVLLHRIAPRLTESSRKSLLPPRKPAPKKKKKAEKEKKHTDKKGIPLPPFPAAPRAPGDWLALSKRQPLEEEAPPPEPTKTTVAMLPQRPAMDEWTLVRRKNGDAGWILRSRVLMDLPDHILQHAEGKRITSYFVMGENRDKENKVRPVYLWTTVSSRYVEYDFDLLRLFFWNTRRDRYETGYIERDLRGFLPIVMQQVNAPKSTNVAGKMQGLSFEVEKADGQRYRRYYAFLGDRLRYSGEEVVARPPAATEAQPPPKKPVQEPAAPAKPSWLSRLKNRIAHVVFSEPEPSGI